jgi:hypothetical protein
MNTTNPLLGAAGAPLYQVGADAHTRFETGDYIVSLEWLNDGRKSEPVMLIWARHGSDHAGVFGICLSSIGKYADPSGKPTPQAFLECWRALPILGRAQRDMEVYRLLDVILRHTPDLIRMPPSPREVRLRDAGQPVLEITRHDEQGRRVDEALV